jgi:hypothetical protein
MFVGPVDLKNGTCMELVVTPLKGTNLRDNGIQRPTCSCFA